MEIEETLRKLEEDGVEHLWVIYHDYGGRSCTKTVPVDRFRSVLERGIVFARANLDFTLADHQAMDAIFLAETGDFLAVPDPRSYAVVPYRKATARMHAYMRADAEGNVWDGCPRMRLEKIVKEYAAEGLSVNVAFEAEFTLFSVDEYGKYNALQDDGMFTVAGLDRNYELMREIIECLRSMGVRVEQLGKEYGPGQYEVTTRHGAPIKAVDDYLTLKEVVRALSRDSGCVGTFMPKPFSQLPGNGLHVHLSIWDIEGENDLGIGKTDETPLSQLGMNLLGGLLAHAPGLTGLGAPIVNSYKRLLPGSWAPAHICWGVGNRAALVRIPAMGSRRRIEYRSGDCSSNPFIYLAGLLAAGLDGIRNRLEPRDPVAEDVGHLSTEQAVSRGLEFLPRKLPQALNELEADKVLADALGPIIFPEFLKVKRTELEEYDLNVHPWERELYLETI